MRLSHCLFALMLSIAGTAGQARAGLLVLNYVGKTADGSSLAGAALSPGADFEVHAVFDSVPIGVSGRIANYQPTEITATVGGTSYSGIDASLFTIQFGDNRGGGSYDYAFLGTPQTVGIVPYYTTTTPDFDATAASPTVFSGYLGSFQNTLTLSTTSGDLILTYDLDTGVETSITAAAVPEPSSIIMLATGAMGLVGHGWRRAKRTIA